MLAHITKRAKALGLVVTSGPKRTGKCGARCPVGARCQLPVGHHGYHQAGIRGRVGGGVSWW